jgi:hypothetical protein
MPGVEVAGGRLARFLPARADTDPIQSLRRLSPVSRGSDIMTVGSRSIGTTSSNSSRPMPTLITGRGVGAWRRPTPSFSGTR